MDNDKAIAALEEALPYVEAPFDYSYGDPELSQRITGALASLRAIAPAPADQSDAGRDSVIEELLRQIANQLAWNTGLPNPSTRPFDDMKERAFQILSRGLPLIVRTLASAPSETVGRGELHDVVTHRFAWRSAIVQAFEKAPNDADHEANQLYWKYELSVFDKTFNLLHRLHILPTADRDAIREALKREEQYLIRQCRSEADIMPGDIQGAFHRIRTAALGLIGEG